MKNIEFIAYDAGCGIWEIEPFDSSVDWHSNEYRGTKKECNAECGSQMNVQQSHYVDAPCGSIWDY